MWGDERLAGYAGFAATAGLVAGAAAIGSMPMSGDSPHKALAITVSHRARMLAGLNILTAGEALTLAFLVGLWVVVRRLDPGRDLAAAIGVMTGAVVFALAAAANAVAAATALRAPHLSAAAARSAWDLYGAMSDASNVVTVVTVGAFAVALWKLASFGRWAAGAGVGVAVLHVVAAASLARDGAFSPAGPVAVLAGFSFLAWMVALSAVLLRDARAVADPLAQPMAGTPA